MIMALTGKLEIPPRGVNKPPSRYDVTVRVARDDGHPLETGGLCVTASGAASSKNASILSA